MQSNPVKIIPVVILILSSLFVFNFLRGHNPSARGVIFVSGNVEASDVDLSFQVGGKIQEILTDEGKTIKKGDVLARIDTEELLHIKNQAEAALKEAESTYSQLKDDYARLENLFKEGAVSAQKRDTAKTDMDVAQAKVKTQNATLELASLRLGYAELVSPLNGFVLTKSAEAGEVVSAGRTIVTATDLTDIWLTAYIREQDLGRVKLNQEADIRTDTFPQKTYKGRVSFISQESEFTPKHIQTKEERVKLVFRIKIKVDNETLELKPGMPADASIHTNVK